MTDLNRLRDIIRQTASRELRRELTYVPIDVPDGPARATDCAACLGAVPVATAAGPCLVIERVYEPTMPHGDVFVGDGNVSGQAALGWLAGTDAALSLERVAFVDVETTGLSGGAGMCAFLVGCATFEDGAFRIRQFFLPTFAHERALLTAVAEHLDDIDVLVTYNGKSFDLPVMETRWLFHRMTPPLGETLHVDMLHPARRFWRGRGRHRLHVLDRFEESCTLVSLERALFGFVRYGDVSGFEIPGRYFHYVRTGDAQPLEPVLEHNRLDLISLALITAHAVRLLREGPSTCLDASECIALGRTYEAVGEGERALASYVRAAGLDTVDALDRVPPSPRPSVPSSPVDRRPLRDQETQSDALRRLALLLRRRREYLRAAAAWQRILGLSGVPPAVRHEALEALAIHHEHRARDLAVARDLALGALGADPSSRQHQALAHRLARLDAKLARRNLAAAAPLRPLLES